MVVPPLVIFRSQGFEALVFHSEGVVAVLSLPDEVPNLDQISPFIPLRMSVIGGTVQVNVSQSQTSDVV